MSALRAPFPWFGGKRRVAPEVWERFREQAHTPAIFGEPGAPVYRVRWARRGEQHAIERL